MASSRSGEGHSTVNGGKTYSSFECAGERWTRASREIREKLKYANNETTKIAINSISNPISRLPVLYNKTCLWFIPMSQSQIPSQVLLQTIHLTLVCFMIVA